MGVSNQGGLRTRKKATAAFSFPLYCTVGIWYTRQRFFKIPQRPSLAFLLSFGGENERCGRANACRCRLLLLLLLRAMGHRGPINACLLSLSLTARICFLLRFSEFKQKRYFIFAEHVRKKFLCYSTLIFLSVPGRRISTTENVWCSHVDVGWFTIFLGVRCSIPCKSRRRSRRGW